MSANPVNYCTNNDFITKCLLFVAFVIIKNQHYGAYERCPLYLFFIVKRTENSKKKYAYLSLKQQFIFNLIQQLAKIFSR